MSGTDPDTLAAAWTRLGAMFLVEPAAATPDVERLLLDTARHCPAHSRLFVLAASWLAQYQKYVSVRRLALLIREELEQEHRPTMGLLLDSVRTRTGNDRFDDAILACGGTAVDPRPLFDVDRENPAFARMAEMRASPLSQKWGRWMTELKLKPNTIRPEHWMVENNPRLMARDSPIAGKLGRDQAG